MWRLTPPNKEAHEYGVLLYRFLLIMAFYSVFRILFFCLMVTSFQMWTVAVFLPSWPGDSSLI